jgi:hypothetical protein
MVKIGWIEAVLQAKTARAGVSLFTNSYVRWYKIRATWVATMSTRSALGTEACSWRTLAINLGTGAQAIANRVVKAFVIGYMGNTEGHTAARRRLACKFKLLVLEQENRKRLCM